MTIQRNMREFFGLIKLMSNKHRWNILILFFTIFIMYELVLIFDKIMDLNNDYSYPKSIDDLELSSLWEKSEGEMITIAFLDSGIHDELRLIYGDRVVHSYNVILDNDNVHDAYGHGTSMICIATCDYESTGIYGIAPKTMIIPIKVFDDNGETKSEYIAKGIRYAVDNNADIINISFGSYHYDQDIKDALVYAKSNNVFVISSSGDFTLNEIAFPANHPETISIGNSNTINLDSAGIEKEVDFLLPGNDISTVIFDDNEEGLRLIIVSGCSSSTSIFSGLIALKLSIIEKELHGTFYFWIMNEKIEKDLEDIIEK